MQSIINNRRANRSQVRPSSTNALHERTNHRHNRRQFELNNGYNRFEGNRSNTRANPSHLVPSTFSTSNNELPSALRYNLFETTIDVCANNLRSELENDYENTSMIQYDNNYYYSTFEYENLSIRFFHNEPLNHENLNDAIENVVRNINNREIQNLLNVFQNDEMTEFIDNTLQDDNTSNNSPETIEKIKQNITQGEYIKHSSVLKNHICPVLLTDFEDNDIIALFSLCGHAIHESTCEKYVKTFTKCPLCNHKLFQL